MSNRAVGLVGTVGVPARYGGFETLAEQLARNIDPQRLVLWIYCQRSAYEPSARTPRFESHLRVFIPLRANGPASMVHDVLAMLHAAFVARVDAMLVLGYSGGWFLPVVRLLRPGMRIVVNVDGMEWRRDKFGKRTRTLLKLLERLAVWSADVVIADNVVLQHLLQDEYGRSSELIAYGGDHTVRELQVSGSGGYFLSVARIEPENNVHQILRAFEVARRPLVFVGNWKASRYGRELAEAYRSSAYVTLMNPIYDVDELARLRAGSVGYVHGHSVGGTNPSLVEAIFHSSRIIAFDCAFNRATLDGAGEYFADVESLVRLLSREGTNDIPESKLLQLRDRYRWSAIASEYERVLQSPG